jgi:diguanylate cyclase (GGDEF)-like protein
VVYNAFRSIDRSMPKFKRDRPTIGILPGWSGLAGIIPDRYLASVLKGIQSAARVKQCHLLLGWGLGRVNQSNGDTYPAWPQVALDSDFVPVGPWNTDGLIVFAPLRHEARSRYMQELSDQGFPVLYIATGEKGLTISADNEGGIHQAVAHLVEHGHRQIAFIAGDPADKGDSATRLQAYYAALARHDLETYPALVTHGWHTFSGGYAAAEAFINSGVPFTALIASDDNCAVGAMQAIRDKGWHIPDDVAIIGFDDQPDAMAQIPPLASIHVPLTLIGEQALALMFDHLVAGYDLASVQIPTRLVPRQSCGCMPKFVSFAGRRRRTSELIASHMDSDNNDLQTAQQKMVAEMLATLPPASLFPLGARTDRLCNKLVQAFYTSLKEKSAAGFQSTLMGILQELELAAEDIDSWQNIVSVLRREMTDLPVPWSQARTQYLAEDLLHQARTAISESAQRQDNRHQYEWEITAQALSELTARLSATLEERQAVQVLESQLPSVGIRHVRVALFEKDEADETAWSVLLNSHSEEASRRFRTREFPPMELYPENELLNLVLVPLVFQDESFGYVAFDAGNLGPCEILARQLAATFKAARLHAQVLELSLTDALTGAYNRRYFDMFLNNEVDRSRRFGRTLGIMILDIDHFKAYNDTYGHQVGDKALQWIARCLQQERRTADVVARIGGEEFALILPETGALGATYVAEKIRVAIQQAGAELHRPLTLSIGISTLHGTDIDAEVLIQQADLALYEAKGKGRDQICVFNSAGSLHAQK